jgi:hypothetical protein
MKRLLSALSVLLFLVPALAGARSIASYPAPGRQLVCSGRGHRVLSHRGGPEHVQFHRWRSVNILNISTGKADIGFSVGSLFGAAVPGQGAFKEKVENAVLLCNLYPQITYFIARKDFVEKNNVKTLKDALNVASCASPP